MSSGQLHRTARVRKNDTICQTQSCLPHQVKGEKRLGVPLLQRPPQLHVRLLQLHNLRTGFCKTNQRIGTQLSSTALRREVHSQSGVPPKQRFMETDFPRGQIQHSSIFFNRGQGTHSPYLDVETRSGVKVHGNSSSFLKRRLPAREYHD